MSTATGLPAHLPSLCRSMVCCGRARPSHKAVLCSRENPRRIYPPEIRIFLHLSLKISLDYVVYDCDFASLSNCMMKANRLSTKQQANMKNKKRSFHSLAIRLLFGVALVFTLASGAQAPKLLPASPEAIRRWQDMRFGMFIHWGPVSLTGLEIGWSRGDQTPIDVYDNLYKQFNPANFNAEEWVRIAKDAGMKYCVPMGWRHAATARAPGQCHLCSSACRRKRRLQTKRLRPDLSRSDS